MIAGVLEQNWICTSYIAAVCLIMTVEGVNTNLSGKQFLFWFLLNSSGMSRLHSCRIPVKNWNDTIMFPYQPLYETHI